VFKPNQITSQDNIQAQGTKEDCRTYEQSLVMSQKIMIVEEKEYKKKNTRISSQQNQGHRK
jgi:hypothetical protein